MKEDFGDNIFLEEISNRLNNSIELLNSFKDKDIDSDDINELFRELHSTKAAFDLLNILEAKSIIHKLEDILVMVRDGNMQLSDEAIELFINSIKIALVVTIEINQNFIISQELEDIVSQIEKDIIKLKNSKHKTIILYDSSIMLKKMLKDILEDSGYDVLIADSLIDTKEMIVNSFIDLIICDITLEIDEFIDIFSSLQSDFKIILLCNNKSDIDDSLFDTFSNIKDCIYKKDIKKKLVDSVNQVLGYKN